MNETPTVADYAYSADELAWFAREYADTEWMAYVHGMDECFTGRNPDGPAFTEDTIREYVADMAVWNREHVAQGLESTPVTVFHFGVPVTPSVAPACAAEVSDHTCTCLTDPTDTEPAER